MLEHSFIHALIPLKYTTSSSTIRQWGNPYTYLLYILAVYSICIRVLISPYSVHINKDAKQTHTIDTIEYLCAHYDHIEDYSPV